MDFNDLKYIVKSFVGDKGTCSNAEQENYYFNHIPKTGGTTLRYMLYEYIGANNIYPNAFEYFIKNRGRYLVWDRFQGKAEHILPRYSLLMGHYDFQPLPLYTSQPKVFSFFRNPMDCVTSSIRYNMKRGRRYSRMTLDEILEKELRREGSIQAKHMGYNRKNPNMNEVLSNIDRLDCIGIAEQFDRSIALLNSSFDWSLKYKTSKNVSQSALELTNEQLQKIKEATTVDQEVYEYALSSFINRCQKLQL